MTNHVPYRIETFNLGLDMDTVLHLYGTDGSTELAYDDDDGVGLASHIDWPPPAAGTYYVLVAPYDEYSTTYCDAVYDLIILPVRGQIYLPHATRNTKHASRFTLHVSRFTHHVSRFTTARSPPAKTG